MLRSAVNYEDNFESCVCVLHITSFRLREFLPCKPICLKPTLHLLVVSCWGPDRCNHPSRRALLPPFAISNRWQTDRYLSNRLERNPLNRFPEFFLTPTLLPARARVALSWYQGWRRDVVARDGIEFNVCLRNRVKFDSQVSKPEISRRASCIKWIHLCLHIKLKLQCTEYIYTLLQFTHMSSSSTCARVKFNLYAPL